MARKQPLQDASLAETYADIRADYSAAKTSRFRRARTGVPTAGAGADYHYRSEGDYLRLLEWARDFDRNDVLMGSLVDRACHNTIQDGITVDPATSDDGLNAELKASFQEWADSPELCDLQGEATFSDIQWMALRDTQVAGDILGLANRSGALEMVESHRLRTPKNTSRNVVHGVLLDKDSRKRLEYWLTKDNVDPARSVSRVADVRAYKTRDEDENRQVFHVYHPKRVTQTRGVTAFAPCFDEAEKFADISFAKLVQQQMVSCFALIEETEGNYPMPSKSGDAMGPQTTEVAADGTTRTMEGWGPGMRIKGARGTKIRMDSPNVPNPEFFMHMRLVIQLIGINLGMPLVLALMDASETNFSGWRGAMEQAKLGFRSNQRMIWRRLVKPVYQWHVRRRMAVDRTLARLFEKLGQEIFRANPGYPTWPYVEPLKDASADLLETRNALISQRRRCAKRNIDWDDLVTEIVEDNAKLIVAAQKKADALNKEFPGLNITWRELACLPTPDGMSVSLASTMNQDDVTPSSPTRKEPQNAA